MTDTTAADPGQLTTNQRHGILVAEARVKKRISQATLAQTADTTQQTISRIEKGEQGTTDALRIRIARALGSDTADLFPYFDDEGESDEQ